MPASRRRVVAAADRPAAQCRAVLGERLDSRRRPARSTIGRDDRSRDGDAVVEPLRRCSRCLTLLPESRFNRFGAGRQWWCRGCFKTYYAERRAHHRERNNALKTRRVEEAHEFVFGYLSQRPCVDCGERDPVVLEFDHVAGKRAEVARRCPVRRGVRLPSPRRAGWRRLAPDLAPGQWRSVRHERNVRFVVSALAGSGCVDCGERDACVLEFDHIGEKTGGVMRLARKEVSLLRLEQEIARCEARCVNCHRRRTSQAGGHYRTRSAVPPARVELALRD